MNLRDYINVDLDHNYGNSRLDDLETIKKTYPTYRFKDLKNISTNAVPIALFEENNELMVSFSNSPTHCLGVGCTGSGKSQSLAIPKLHILSELANKPSFFVIDIKGELLESVGQKLVDQGYKVRVIDLDEPELSCSWNPLSTIYDTWQYAHHLGDYVEEHTDSVKDYPNMKVGFKRTKPPIWYMFENVCYGTQKDLNSGLKRRKESILLQVSEELRDFAYSMIEITSQKEPHWEQTARDIFIGITMALLEKSVIEGPFRVTKDKFNLMNIVNIATTYSEQMFETLFESLNREQNAYKYSGKYVFLEAKVTRSCYFGTLTTQLSQYKSYGVQKVTLTDTIDMPNIGDDHVAIFLKMDDLNTANYHIAQLFVSRLYKSLVKLAKNSENRTLKNPFHFILDEFGNFPAFRNFGMMISVSRSLNIWFTMIVQSYYQLEIKYGVDLAKVIIQNSNMQMFFGTNDYKTKLDFAESCGKVRRIAEDSYLVGNENYITAYQTRDYDTVTTADLSYIKPGECYITAFQEPILKTELKRAYTIKEFNIPLKTNFSVIDDVFLSDEKYLVTYDKFVRAKAIDGTEKVTYVPLALRKTEADMKKSLSEIIDNLITETELTNNIKEIHANHLGERLFRKETNSSEVFMMMANPVVPQVLKSALNSAYSLYRTYPRFMGRFILDDEIKQKTTSTLAKVMAKKFKEYMDDVEENLAECVSLFNKAIATIKEHLSKDLYEIIINALKLVENLSDEQLEYLRRF